MDWCRLGTSYYLDHAILRAGEAAEVLFLRCLAYSGAQESRGRIDKAVLPLLTPQRTKARMEALVREGLLLDAGEAVQIRSWQVWQERLDSESDRRRKDRERKAREREAKKSEEVSTDSPRTVQPESARIEVEVEEEKEQHPRSADADRDLAFEEFWLVYPRKVGKGQARKAWRTAIKKSSASEIMAGALRYAKQPGREEQFTAHPTSWLNGERWLDQSPTPQPMKLTEPAWMR